MLKLCKYCNIELRESKGHLYCSLWCKQQKKLNTKKDKIKLPRKCKCGNDLKRYRSKCDDCLLKPFEYTKCENKCLNCGGDITARLHKKYKKKFCEAKCAKAYYYRHKVALI